MIEFLYFVLALAVMIFGSRLVINHSIKLSQLLGISQLAIGFVLVAVFVSLPDLLVASIATVDGNIGLGVGDALGSTLANICLVLGVATFIRNIKIERKHMVDSAEMLLLISLIPLALLATHTTNVSHGLVLLVVFVLYVFFIVKEKYKIDKKVRVSKKDVGFEVGLFLAGILLVVVGARFLVNAATLIAGEWGFSGAGIGLTLVSFGTTLPELMIDFTAIRKGEVALAIGEILGSSVVNLTLILGAALSLGSQAIDFSQFVIPAAFIVIANSFLVYNMIKHEGIGKAQGIVFLGMYVLFIGIELALHASGARV